MPTNPERGGRGDHGQQQQQPVAAVEAAGVADQQVARASFRRIQKTRPRVDAERRDLGFQHLHGASATSSAITDASPYSLVTASSSEEQDPDEILRADQPGPAGQR